MGMLFCSSPLGEFKVRGNLENNSELFQVQSRKVVISYYHDGIKNPRDKSYLSGFYGATLGAK